MQATPKPDSFFLDQRQATDLLESLRWGTGGRAVCPRCASPKYYHLKVSHTENRHYKCAGCFKRFTPLKGTIFENTKAPLGKWLYALTRLCIEKENIPVLQLAEELDVNYRTAWRMKSSILRSRSHIRRVQAWAKDWSMEEDKILMKNWTSGEEVGKNLKRSAEEIEERLEVLFEKYDDGIIN